ncbi:MAG TPA: hydrogenase expression/formation protein HypE [Gemmatimonadaceae bacterium]|nr:hydrogenase expression/formation protein HypE [Gemmatimonadaceae bacterium]
MTTVPETITSAFSLACPAPSATNDRVQLGHGSGGKMTAALLNELFFPRFDNAALARMGDGSLVHIGGVDIVVSTDTFVVTPIEFPGGDIGSLAVHGTLNDLAMMGARPACLTAGFVLEEGLPFDVLDRIVRSMARAADQANVPIVAGDTKVVERGKADGLYINTTGLGMADRRFRPAPDQARPGDIVIVSGAIGRHGMAIMAAREGLAFDTTITSDSACLTDIVETLRALRVDVHTLRDPTRGGVASALNEIARASGVGIDLDEPALPVPDDVRAACEVLGLDPLYVANEGVLLAIVPSDAAGAAVTALRSDALGREAVPIGRVVEHHPGMVTLRTTLGGTRIVDLLPGDQLPRIC